MGFAQSGLLTLLLAQTTQNNGRFLILLASETSIPAAAPVAAEGPATSRSSVGVNGPCERAGGGVATGIVVEVGVTTLCARLGVEFDDEEAAARRGSVPGIAIPYGTLEM